MPDWLKLGFAMHLVNFVVLNVMIMHVIQHNYYEDQLFLQSSVFFQVHPFYLEPERNHVPPSLVLCFLTVCYVQHFYFGLYLICKSFFDIVDLARSLKTKKVKVRSL